MYLRSTLLTLISALFIGCGGGSSSATATTDTATATTDTDTTTTDTTTDTTTNDANISDPINQLFIYNYGSTTLKDCNYVYFDTIELGGTDSTFELSNCDIGELIFHADNSVLRIINTGAITFDHNGTGNTIEATQADLDTIDDPTLQEVAIIY